MGQGKGLSREGLDDRLTKPKSFTPHRHRNTQVQTVEEALILPLSPFFLQPLYVGPQGSKRCILNVEINPVYCAQEMPAESGLLLDECPDLIGRGAGKASDLFIGEAQR